MSLQVSPRSAQYISSKQPILILIMRELRIFQIGPSKGLIPINKRQSKKKGFIQMVNGDIPDKKVLDNIFLESKSSKPLP